MFLIDLRFRISVYLYVFALAGSFSLIAPAMSGAQSLVEITVPVEDTSGLLASPFAGGLNAPQFSQADLNQDGQPDLIVFDRIGYSVQTYLATGLTGQEAYILAPEWAKVFPPMRYWMLLRDYNHDGIADIFTPAGINPDQSVRVFKGELENGSLTFKPVRFDWLNCPSCPDTVLHYGLDGSQNAYLLRISLLGIPDINDVDQDGDLDILAFEAEMGNQLHWYRNQSVEQGSGPDSLIFDLHSSCWGKFWDNSLAGCGRLLSAEPDSCAMPRSNTRHPGSTITSFDLEPDGDPDLLMGSLGKNCLNLLVNGGDMENAWITDQDTMFPGYNTPVDIFNFPAAFQINADNNGIEDWIVAPSGTTALEDIFNVWHYEHENGQFFLKNKRFLSETMIDLGTGAHPFFADVNEDGLYDLVVGNLGRWFNSNPKYATLTLYLNTGAQDAPEFTLADRDWLGFSQFSPSDFDFMPTCADVDHDGDCDWVVGSASGRLYFVENLSAQGQPGQYGPVIQGWMDIDPGISSAPAIFDLNEDGLPDLIVGEMTGNINFYPNVGAPDAPQFDATPSVQNLGDINMQTSEFTFGNSAPTIIRLHDQTPVLITGSYEGSLKTFANPTPASSPFTVLPMTQNMTRPGWRSSPALADINQDGWFDMAAGLQSGGIKLYSTPLQAAEINASHHSPSSDWQVKVIPNPAQSKIRIVSSTPVTWEIKNSQGTVLLVSEKKADQSDIVLSNWPAGIYYLFCQNSITGKKVVAFTILSK